MDAVLKVPRAEAARRRTHPRLGRQGAAPIAAITCIAVLAAVTSDRGDWRPLSLVLALGATMMVAEVMAVSARRLRVSAALMVQVVCMALLGPAPAVAMAVLAIALDAVVNRVPRLGALNNMAIFTFLGLVGGVMFELLGTWFTLDRHDTAYALLIPPVSVLLMGLNLGLVAVSHPSLESSARLRVLRESGLPTLPVELMNALMATATVLVWAHIGLAAVAALLVVLVITIPLLYSIGNALTSGDERAAEVARLASDRERLLAEVVEAEERERARLAESLHDGPMQRLAALRQDVTEGVSSERLVGHLDATLAETRAIISAFHPVIVRARGFEASLRAAIAPFPAADSVTLTIDNRLDDGLLAASLLLPIAQELVINAVKHADPNRIDISLRADEGRVFLEVSDDGVGIDTADAGRRVQAGHVGLAMVRRRVEDAGGAVHMETRPDGGTRSHLSLPSKVVHPQP